MTDLPERVNGGSAEEVTPEPCREEQELTEEEREQHVQRPRGSPSAARLAMTSRDGVGDGGGDEDQGGLEHRGPCWPSSGFFYLLPVFPTTMSALRGQGLWSCALLCPQYPEQGLTQ